MSLRAAMLGLLCCAAASIARAADFPYTASVVSDGAVFRSGPGEEYYGSGKLAQGTAVEVYRAQGAWLAIRPPEGSFSWVAAKDVELLDGGLAEVAREGAFAAVGSSLEAARDVQQVQLDRGEVVVLLDAAGGEGRAAPKSYRIAPPSGEFRWILARDVDDHPDEAPQWKRASGRVAAPRRAARNAEHRDGGEVAPEREIAAREDWAAAVGAADDAEAREAADAEVAAAPPRSESAVDDALWDDLDAIDLGLSRTVIQEPTAWKLAELRDGAEMVLERATGADVRSRARRLAKRIGRFEDIRERAVALGGGATPGLRRVAVRDELTLDERRTAPPAGSAADGASDGETARAESEIAAAGATAPPDELARKYDGVGTLTRVESSGVGGPQFALVDEAGAVRKYVSAAPGVHLRPFVGRQVGIVGLRGYLPDLKADHVTAKRIEPIRASTVR